MTTEPYLPTREDLPLNPQPIENELALHRIYRDNHLKGDFNEKYWGWAESVLLTGPVYEQIISDQLTEIERLQKELANRS